MRVTLILRALVARDGVTLTEEAVRFAVEQVAAGMGAEVDEVVELVRSEVEVDHQVTNLAMQVVALEHLLSRVKVRPTWDFFTSTVLDVTNWA